jgi:hypothetical protein
MTGSALNLWTSLVGPPHRLSQLRLRLAGRPLRWLGIYRQSMFSAVCQDGCIVGVASLK